MTNSLFDFFKKQDVKFYRSLDVSHLSSIGIGAICDVAIYPRTENEFLNVVSFLEENEIKYFVSGRLTNVLFCCKKYDGVIVFTNEMNRYCVAENAVVADCGVCFSNMLSKIASFSLGGYEELFGIPGSVGGMVYNNAGAFGKSVSDCFHYGKVYSSDDQAVVTFSLSDMAFSYRKSVLQTKKYILLSAEFGFLKKDESEIKKAQKSVITKRKENQPYGSKSLGSVFKRSEGIPISKLIDELGLKGLRVGGAEISQKHAGFIVNVGGATSDDVLRLIEIVKEKLFREYGVVAEEEIEFLK